MVVDERMYLEHFELKEAPFSITPDPRFVHLTSQHRDALAHLLFGITQGGGGGFVQLTGEVGTGKTTLCRLLMAQVPETVRIALVLNPMQQPIELLRTICDELRILLPKRSASIKVLTDALTRYLLESYAAGLRVVLIIDEAQNLSFESLEQVRMLTNLETPTQKLLQVILLGQPELRELLAREDLRQLAQRITARFHLAPLSAQDTVEYVEHRLAVAGRKKPLFDHNALRELHRCTQGYPRAINVVADRALLGAYARGQQQVDAAMVRLAADEVAGRSPRRTRTALAMAGLCVVAALAGFAWYPRMTADGPMPDVVPSNATPAINALDTHEAMPASFHDPAPAVAIAVRWWNATLEAPRCGDRLPSAVTLCARLRLNMALLQRLDRPVLLEMRAAGEPQWQLVRTLDTQTVVVATPDGLRRVAWAELADQWFGDALLAVPAPEAYDGALLAGGASGALVEQVHAALAEFDQASAVDATRYGDDTVERVRRLQAYFGLRADGLVGPETMAVLVALQRAGPKLSDVIDPQAFVSASQR